MFFKRKKFDQIDINFSQMACVGEPVGDGLGILKQAIGDWLRQMDGVDQAWLLLFSYGHSAGSNVTLCIDATAEHETIVKSLSTNLNQMLDKDSHIDIVFIKSLPEEIKSSILSSRVPFFRKAH